MSKSKTKYEKYYVKYPTLFITNVDENNKPLTRKYKISKEKPVFLPIYKIIYDNFRFDEYKGSQSEFDKALKSSRWTSYIFISAEQYGDGSVTKGVGLSSGFAKKPSPDWYALDGFSWLTDNGTLKEFKDGLRKLNELKIPNFVIIPEKTQKEIDLADLRQLQREERKIAERAILENQSKREEELKNQSKHEEELENRSKLIEETELKDPFEQKGSSRRTKKYHKKQSITRRRNRRKTRRPTKRTKKSRKTR